MKRRRARRRVFRPGFGGAVKIALSIVLIVECFYLLAANLVLGRWLRSWVNGDELALHLEYDRAWSPWPGRVYAKNLRLRVQDSNVQFEIRTDAVEVDVVLTSLLRRTFRATHLDVEGLKFKFRHKLEGLPENPRMVRALPPIEGFSDPPLMDKKPKKPPGKLWTIHITGVDARIAELWLQQFRSLGSGRVWGGFRLEPTRRLWVEPAALSLDPGPLNAGEKELVARDFGGRIDATVHEMDLERLHGWQVFSRISTHVALKANLANSNFLQMFVDPGDLQVEKGAGPLHVDVRLAQGVFRAPSTITYTSTRIELHSKQIRVFGDARVDLAVPEPDRGQLSIAATEIGFEDRRTAQPGAPILFKRPRIELETRNLAVYETPKASGGRLDLPELVARDLRTLEQVLSGETRLAGGPLTGRARARLDQRGEVTGQLELAFHDARVSNDGVTVGATGRFETSLVAPEVLGTSGELRGVLLEIQRGFLRTKNGSTGLGALDARADQVPYSDFVPTRIVATVNARFADARPVLKTLGIEPTGLAAAAAALVDLSDLEVNARAKLEGKNIDVQLLRARTDAVRARGQWRRVGVTERGAFLLITELVNVGLEISDGETTVHPLASESWLDRALAALRLGSVTSGDRGLRPAPARVVR
jgi:hypothetical protein